MTRTTKGPLAVRIGIPGAILGVGLGGFVDGILFHQVLQWHHLVSSTSADPGTLRGLETNTLWDGLFHVVTWSATVVGIALVHRAATQDPGMVPGRVIVGWALVGWGIFNLVEGLVNHHVLQIHHVKTGSYQTFFDVAFLALGGLLVLVGARLAKRGPPI